MDLNKPGSGRKLIGLVNLNVNTKQRNWARQVSVGLQSLVGNKTPKPSNPKLK